ncbi:hypothetical protein GQ54DRAFT_291607, partial [Martensiomyces pterosporus]
MMSIARLCPLQLATAAKLVFSAFVASLCLLAYAKRILRRSCLHMPKEEYLTFNIRDEYAVWQRIQPEFVSRLPLRNLIWKGGLSQAPRFVEQLNIKISTSDIDSSHDALPMATAMQASPLLNIYLVEADADADTYKAVIKPRIKNWVAKASQRKGEEWLVVYLPNEAE